MVLSNIFWTGLNKRIDEYKWYNFADLFIKFGQVENTERNLWLG